MTITATQVKALRDKTGVSMGDCKKALVEAEGDEAQAIDLLKKKYAGKLEERADKEAANGRIGAFTNGSVGALVELRCETDFVAKNEDFTAAANALAQIVCETGETDVTKVMSTAGSDGRTGKDIITDVFGKLKENMGLEKAVSVPGGVASYVHHNGLVGTVIAADKDGDGFARQACMHVAATKVDGLNRDSMAAEAVEAARAEMAEQAKGKPAEIVEKIVAGKMDKWFAERVLLEQAYALSEEKKSVEQVASEAGVVISGYLKMELGAK
jgi:elongation factor Ts